MYGFLDWTPLCRLPDEDRQTRECKLLGVRVWSGISDYPPSGLTALAVNGSNSVLSYNKLLGIGVEKRAYQIGDDMEIRLATGKPLYVALYILSSAGKVEAVDVRDELDGHPLAPNIVHPFPSKPGTTLPVGGPVGTDHLIAIASERPIPEGIGLLDSQGKLTEAAFSLSPTVVRLEYRVEAATGQ